MQEQPQRGCRTQSSQDPEPLPREPDNPAEGRTLGGMVALGRAQPTLLCSQPYSWAPSLSVELSAPAEHEHLPAPGGQKAAPSPLDTNQTNGSTKLPLGGTGSVAHGPPRSKLPGISIQRPDSSKGFSPAHLNLERKGQSAICLPVSPGEPDSDAGGLTSGKVLPVPWLRMVFQAPL